MTFGQELFLIIVDKAILAVGLAIIGYFLNRRLERDKANEGIRQKVAEARALAYLGLWQMTAKIDKLDAAAFTDATAVSLLDEVTNWYYQQGNGLYLSHPATRLFLAARSTLKATPPNIVTIKSAFSQMRTQLKQDIGVYSDRETRLPVT